MSKAEVLIKAVTVQGLSYGEVASRHGVSKSLVHRLHHRWLVEGDGAFLPRSSRPRTVPTRTPEPVRSRIPTTPSDPNLWRVRYDTVDGHGKISLRHSGRMMHLGIGRAHARTEIIALVHNHEATIITLDGTVLSEHTLDAKRGYQPQRKNG